MGFLTCLTNECVEHSIESIDDMFGEFLVEGNEE